MVKMPRRPKVKMPRTQKIGRLALRRIVRECALEANSPAQACRCIKAKSKNLEK